MEFLLQRIYGDYMIPSRNKTRWEENVCLKLYDDNNRIYGLAITVHHPLFNQVYELFKDWYIKNKGSDPNSIGTVATEEDLKKIRV